MSDYLSHIVEQSMGIAESVRPLIAPMFALPSFSAFLSLGDMMRQSPDSVTEASIPVPPTPSEILSAPFPRVPIDVPEPLSQSSAHDQSARLLSQAEKQHEQPFVQSLQSEPESTRLSHTIDKRDDQHGIVGAGVDEVVGRGPLWSPVQSPPIDEGSGSLPAPASSPMPPVQSPPIDEGSGSLPAPASSPMPLAYSPSQAEGLESLPSPFGAPSVDERLENLTPPVHSPSVQERLESLPPVQPIFLSPSNDVVRMSAEQSLVPIEPTIDGTPIQVEQNLAATQRVSNQSMPDISTIQPRSVLTAQNNRSVQEKSVTAKMGEATVSGDITAPGKQPAHDFLPLDALIHQQSASYSAPFLPGELSLPSDQTGEESRRDTAEAAGSERELFAASDERNELLPRRTSRRPLPTQEVTGNLAAEPGAEQNPLMVSTRRDDGANELTPIIRVSIGRVEVRTTIAPAAPAMKRAAPVAPAISLSDYLRRRKGGVG